MIERTAEDNRRFDEDMARIAARLPARIERLEDALESAIRQLQETAVAIRVNALGAWTDIADECEHQAESGRLALGRRERE